MNQGFNFRFGEMQENDPTKSQSENSQDHTLYPSASNTRNLCLQMRNGDQIFLNYSYLISGEYSKETATITLTFTTHIIVMKGSALDVLFHLLMDHIPRTLVEVDERYVSIETEQTYTLKEITVSKL